MNGRWAGELGALEAQILGDGRIDGEDVLRLRRAIYQNGEISRDEAHFLFYLNRQACDKIAAWEEFFVEALSDFFYWRNGSDSALAPDAEQMLLDAIGTEAPVGDATELHLLLNLMFRINGASERLRRFVLDAVRHSVLHSEQALFGRARRRPGVIDSADVEVIRRLVYGMGSQSGFAISRIEAEFLFELNDATAGRANDPGWRELFVKAVTMYLLFSGDTPDRVDEPEAHWLLTRINGDGRSCDNERELLAYLKKETGGVHPLLRPLCQRMGV
jgi:hypothetical protein